MNPDVLEKNNLVYQYFKIVNEPLTGSECPPKKKEKKINVFIRVKDDAVADKESEQ